MSVFHKVLSQHLNQVNMPHHFVTQDSSGVHAVFIDLLLGCTVLQIFLK